MPLDWIGSYGVAALSEKVCGPLLAWRTDNKVARYHVHFIYSRRSWAVSSPSLHFSANFATRACVCGRPLGDQLARCFFVKRRADGFEDAVQQQAGNSLALCWRYIRKTRKIIESSSVSSLSINAAPVGARTRRSNSIIAVKRRRRIFPLAATTPGSNARLIAKHHRHRDKVG